MASNPSAFPTKQYNRNIMQFEHMGGMTLRDYFAANAMQAMTHRGEANVQMVSLQAYAMADAMLKARDENSR